MKKEFIINRQGKDFVLYAGLLDEAHSQGLKSIESQIIQLPDESNNYTTIVVARVETEKGVFTGIGDANTNNVTPFVKGHTIRMAETRAKARALRDAVNVGMAALEELDDDITHNQTEQPKEKPKTNGYKAPERTAPGDPNDTITPKQIQYAYQIGSKQLHWSEEEVDRQVRAWFKKPIAELNKAEASKLIDDLLKEAKAAAS